MLGKAAFAFIVMTTEDEWKDGSLHARENVIHEAGLFQARLGLEKAILLLEIGTTTFFNIHGLTWIPFTKVEIRTAFPEVLRVLKREGLLNGSGT